MYPTEVSCAYPKTSYHLGVEQHPNDVRSSFLVDFVVDQTSDTLFCNRNYWGLFVFCSHHISTHIRSFDDSVRPQSMPLTKHLRPLFFFVSRRIASRIHEISDPKKALVLSLRAEYTRSRVQKKTLSTRGLDKTSLNHSVCTSCPVHAELKNLKKSISRSEQMKHAYW